MLMAFGFLAGFHPADIAMRWRPPIL